MEDIENTQDRARDRVDAAAKVAANDSAAVERVESRKLCESSRRWFDEGDRQAKARQAALLPEGRVTCQISKRAYNRLINFSRRGGPEPEWYRFRDWNTELGHEVPRLRTPEEMDEDQAEAAAYEKRWEASIEARYTLILHTACHVVESALRKAANTTADTASSTGGFPNGYIRFSLPDDMVPRKPHVELAVCCELDPDVNPDAAPSMCLMVACLDEAITSGVPCASENLHWI